MVRVLGIGGVGWPVTYPGKWKPGPGWGLGVIHPLWPIGDAVLEVEVFENTFDVEDLSRRGALVVDFQFDAVFTDLALGLRLHRADPGWRPFGQFSLALVDVSRQSIHYYDESGSHELRGSEIFMFDPALVVDLGLELMRPRQIGGQIDARVVIASGRTEPTEMLVALRAGLTVPLR